MDLNLVRKALAQGLVLSLSQNQALMRVTGGGVRRGGRGLESTSKCAYWNHVFGFVQIQMCCFSMHVQYVI